MPEQNTVLIEKMSKARTSMIEVLGREQFKQHVESFRVVLKDICAKHNIDELQAVVNILQELESDPQQALLVMAAGVEIVQPSLLDS